VDADNYSTNHLFVMLDDANPTSKLFDWTRLLGCWLTPGFATEDFPTFYGATRRR